MPKQLVVDGRAAGLGNKKTIRAGDLDQDDLKAGTEVTVWQKQVNDDQLLYHGYGPDRRSAASGFVYMDLVASGNGTATAGDDIRGDVVLAVTDSEGDRVLASVTFESLEELRDSANDERTERVIEAAMSAEGDLAGPGRNLEVRIEADDTSDGYEIDPDASTGKLYYGKVQR
ncbi:hypothetical protein EI982_09465 [Haloplanus rallus]|uniref:Uncharacterized protein n=1 Tax=Haloplanus rallus TaxID=1816183 RepID=A0A6B9F6F8_9EURY|nr:hypothetical protein [Haloplanus rallus]QGX95002.1 hypothetical protein EI982_09465 [Haloplanus rallus]